MKNKKKEYILFFILIIISLLIIKESKFYGDEGLFPVSISILLIISSIKGIIEVRKSKNIDVEDITLRPLLVLLCILIYCQLLKYLGYFISTTILGLLILRVLNYKLKNSYVISVIIITSLVYFIFKILLSVPLPQIY